MRVQHRAGVPLTHNLDVERGLGRRPAAALHHGTRVAVDLENPIGGELTLEFAARRDRETQRTAAQHDAEIAARAENPSSRVEPPPCRTQPASRGGEDSPALEPRS